MGIDFGSWNSVFTFFFQDVFQLMQTLCSEFAYGCVVINAKQERAQLLYKDAEAPMPICVLRVDTAGDELPVVFKTNTQEYIYHPKCSQLVVCRVTAVIKNYKILIGYYTSL